MHMKTYMKAIKWLTITNIHKKHHAKVYKTLQMQLVCLVFKQNHHQREYQDIMQGATIHE